MNKSTLLRIWTIFFWSSYIIAFIGITQVDIDYLHTLNVFIRTIISLVLMFKFRPYWAYNSKITFTEDDWNFVFAASFYLFATTTLNSIITSRFKHLFYKVVNKKEPKTDPGKNAYCKQFCNC